MSQKHVLLIAHDRGGVNLLAPLLSYWNCYEPRIEAWFFSTPMIQYEMASITNGGYKSRIPKHVQNISLTNICRDIQPVKLSGTDDTFIGRSVWTFTSDDLQTILESERWDLVLTGTSVLSDMEKLTWRLCQENSIPCVALCDMWTEYKLRLADKTGKLLIDNLLVIDKRMEREIKAIFDTSFRIQIVGSPHFAQLLKSRKQTQTRRQFIRFISEPMAALFPKAKAHEFNVAEIVIDTLKQLGLVSSLLLRPHPQDDSEGWRRFAYDYQKDGLCLDNEPSWACPLSTKAAIGLSSMMLIELAIAGIPVASFQLPGSDSSYYCLQEEEFGIAVINDAKELKNWVTAPPPPQISQGFVQQHMNAIQRISDLILSDKLLS